MRNSGHQFNTDLLTNPGDVDRATRAFPGMTDVLHHAALQRAFRRFDVPADAAKRRGRVAGLAAIALGVTALAIAASSPNERVLGTIAAVCGILSIVIGFGGALYAGAKRRWLLNRVMTERLRQFHFQAFACRWREIAASFSEPDGACIYAEQREIWFSRFMAPFPGQLDAELTDLLDDHSDKKCWLHPPPRLPAPEEAADLEELFAAYRELRINHQLHYANYKLRDDGHLFPPSPRLQEVIFSYTTLISILVIFAIHLWLAASLSLQGHAEHPKLLGFDIHVWVIWIAIVVLGVRALQEGLQPEREIERYRHYRAGVRAVRDRFDEAASAAEKLEVMLEMERLSFDEFRNFLRSNNEARFVI